MTSDWDLDEPGDLIETDDECRECSAILDEFGRCWFCDRSWIWSGVD